jgi:hypothetical protein
MLEYEIFALQREATLNQGWENLGPSFPTTLVDAIQLGHQNGQAVLLSHLNHITECVRASVCLKRVAKGGSVFSY